MPESRTLPWSPPTEMAMIGSCLLSASARDVLMRELTPQDFYKPGNAAVAAVVIEMHRIGAHVDTVTVSTALANKGLLEIAGGAAGLTLLMAEAPSGGGAEAYAKELRDFSLRRDLIMVCEEVIRRSYDLTTDPEETLDWLRTQLDRIRNGRLVDDGERKDSASFLRSTTEERWIVPNLIERRDRIIITGGEGAGKSQMCLQLAVQLAAGIHPFRRETQMPVRVLVIDVENSKPQVQRRLRPLIEVVDHPLQGTLEANDMAYGWDYDRLWISVRPQGLDLLSRSDRRWFTQEVDKALPDVIVTGPLYKLHAGNPTDEEPARAIAGYFDEIRESYDTAFIIEAHSPHSTNSRGERTLRPFGASLWMRWPEHGFGLRPPSQVDDRRWDFVAWRGSRDDSRTWPRKLARGKPWPWVNGFGPPDDMAQPVNDPATTDPRF